MMLVDNDSFADAIHHLQGQRFISFDLETTGVRPFHGDTLVGISTYAGEQSFYFPFRHKEGVNLDIAKMDALKALVSNRNRTFIMWNAKFDLEFMARDGFCVPHDVEDVMVAAHLMDEHRHDKGLNYKLKDVGRQFVDSNAKDEQIELLDEIIVRGLSGPGDMWKLPPELVAAYAEQDARLTYLLRDFYATYLKKYNLFNLWLECNEYLKCLLSIEQRGMLVDRARVEYLIAQAAQIKIDVEQGLEKHLGYPFNPNSPPQVSKLLGIESTAVDILESMTGQQELVKPIILYRRCTKVIGAYYKPFLRNMDNKGVLHPNLNQIGTATSRLSSRDPNLQALPRDPEDAPEDDVRVHVKQAFIARPGYSLVQADYKQAEIYLGAHYARCQPLIDIIKSGRDIHQETADMVGIDRDSAKRLNFSMQYGIGAKELSSDLGVSLHRASELLSLYNSRFPEMKRLYHDMERLAKEQNYIRLFTGRMKRYGGYLYPTNKASSNLIQGGVAEVMRIASTSMYQQLHGQGIYQLLHVHDSIMLEVPDIYLGWALPAIDDLMTDLSPYEFAVKLKVDIKVGKRWSELEKWKNPYA